MTYYRATVRGPPVTQGSMKGFAIAGHVNIVHQHEKEIKHFREACRKEFSKQNDEDGVFFSNHMPVFVIIRAYEMKPKSAPKSRLWPSYKKYDIDKISRTCLDAMSGTVYDDDCQVVRLDSCKRYCATQDEERTEIYVTDNEYQFASEVAK